MEDSKNQSGSTSSELHRSFQSLRQQLGETILGQKVLIDEILSCLLASGHILITGAPGLAKTTIIKSLSNLLGLSFGRVQFTPDLLPTDITGSDIFDMKAESKDQSFFFQKGPIFANIILADEINRASPRTQSALLEAMQEKKVTFGGKTHDLPLPFIVCATQNPFESEGVFPLPEAQLDRFLLHSVITYPQAKDEINVLENFSKGLLPSQTEGSKHPRLRGKDLEILATESQKLPIEKDFIEIIYEIINLSRQDVGAEGRLLYGAGTRAGMSIIASAKSMAYLNNAEKVRWEHIEKVLKPCLRHRIKLNLQAYYDGETEEKMIDELVSKVKTQFHRKIKGQS